MVGVEIRKWVGCLIILVVLTVSGRAAAAVPMNQIDFWNDSEPSSLIDLDHSAFEDILKKYVATDHPSDISRFNYTAVTQADFAKLNEYLTYLQFMEPRQLTEAEAKAFWINLYNAATLKMVLEAFIDNGSVSKIKARGLPARRWRRDIVTIAQQDMSLEDIMNGVIRPMYKDPRVHYALFFCALGGPDMPTEVFKGDNNEELLSALETNYLQESRAVRVEGDQLVLSEIFKEYDTDFAQSQGALLEYLKSKVSEEVAGLIDTASKVRYEYDTTVNTP